uniref:Uncharacterized protein n=1 Tax=Arundo donax TaxID=35708 RepID=A0A0A8ZYJ6_ARUDO
MGRGLPMAEQGEEAQLRFAHRVPLRVPGPSAGWGQWMRRRGLCGEQVWGEGRWMQRRRC